MAKVSTPDVVAPALVRVHIVALHVIENLVLSAREDKSTSIFDAPPMRKFVLELSETFAHIGKCSLLFLCCDMF